MSYISILLLITYYEIFPILALVEKKTHILKKIVIMLVYNYILFKVYAPPSIYRLQELGWNNTVIEYFYMICEAIRFTAPLLLQILLKLPIGPIIKNNKSNN